MAGEPVRDFLLDEDGDLAVVDGDFSTVGGVQAVPQGIQIRVKMFLGECMLDQSLGVPWLQDILIKNPNQAIVREDLRLAIADTPDVTEAVGADVTINQDREASVSYKASTVYSAAPLAGQVETG